MKYAFAIHQFDVDERAEVVDNDNDLPRIGARWIGRRTKNERRTIMQELGQAGHPVDQRIRCPFLRDRLH